MQIDIIDSDIKKLNLSLYLAESSCSGKEKDGNPICFADRSDIG